jgi:hypothetical protein
MADATGASVSARRWWQRVDSGARSETLEDMRTYVEGGLVPVTCTACRTDVLVKKNSPRHTSVQWISDAAASCPEIGAQLAAGTRASQVLGCTALKRSIEDAVRAGVVAVPDD